LTTLSGVDCSKVDQLDQPVERRKPVTRVRVIRRHPMNMLAHKAYKRRQVETASQADLLLMLYNGLIKFCRQGEKDIVAGDLEAAHRSIIRAQDILIELMSTVDVKAGEIGKALYALYDYMHRQLVTANVHKDAGPLQQVADMVDDLKQTWEEALKGGKNDHEGRAKTGIIAEG